MLYDSCFELTSAAGNSAGSYWQANEHLKALLHHPEWRAFALQTLVGQTQAQIWKLVVQQRLRYDDEQSPQMPALQQKLTSLQMQLTEASAVVVPMQVDTQAFQQEGSVEKVFHDPSASSVQQVWDNFWQAERQLSQGWSYKDTRSMQQQSKLRHGLVAWVLWQVGIPLPTSQGNIAGRFATLWKTWSEASVQSQLKCLETRLKSMYVSNRRTGQLGALKSALAKEVLALQRGAHAASM